MTRSFDASATLFGSDEQSLFQDPTLASVNTLAAVLSVTPRRIRQLAQQGDLIERARGLYDLPHAIQAAAGRAMFGKEHRAQRTSIIDAAAAVLAASEDGFGDLELAGWFELCDQCGVSRNQATLALMQASSLLGALSPTIDATPPQRLDLDDDDPDDD